mmetsp:Transcript_7363/g.16397  ORF Transcript_7363/g.16397 Transcript_7363/m.16397 type:complete len:392 (-) Transcript_7363:1214-2389(-)
MKRTNDGTINEASDDDTRPDKLSKNSSGCVVTSYAQKVSDAKAKTRDAVASCVEGLAKTLISNDGGAGDDIFNSPTVGIAIKHLVKAVLDRPQQYPMPDGDNGDEATVALLPEIDTDILSDDRISQLLTKGVVEELQDPLWARGGSDPDPTMMVRGMRKDVGSSEAHGGRRVSTIMLTLLDGSGLLINARVAVVKTDEVGGLRRGHVIRMNEYVRIFMAQHSDRYSTAGIGLLKYEVVGKGNLPTDIADSAVQQVLISNLQQTTLANASDHESTDAEEECFALPNWDESKRRPPRPQEVCSIGNRVCSEYGTHFFRKCVCDEYPVSERNLEELSGKYFAADRPVSEMSPSMKRNMLYWCYATDIYHVRGWQVRMPLPSCLVFAIQKMHPNK